MILLGYYHDIIYIIMIFLILYVYHYDIIIS